MPPHLAPESTANDWFRFLAKPGEYWDHRLRNAWRKQRTRARSWDQPPDFTHQHDASRALWLNSAPLYIEKTIRKMEMNDAAAMPVQLGVKPNDAVQQQAMIAASRLRNPADPQMISSLKEAPGRLSDIGKEARSAVGEAASDRGWFRFVRHPSQYWDLRTLATRSPSQDDAHSSAPGTAAINEGRARDAHKPARRPGEADFVHQIDPTDTLCVDSAPGWAMEAIANSDGKVPRQMPPPQQLQGGLTTATAAVNGDKGAYQDYRAVKTAGLRGEDHPDLLRRSDGAALWLSRTTGRVSVLQKEWKGEPEKPLQSGHGNGWFDLLRRPWEFYDYRSTKKQLIHPDFVHQRSRGRALWLDSAPLWVLQRILKMDQGPPSTPRPVKVKSPSVKIQEKWDSFLADPHAWEDLRQQKLQGKLSERLPDLVLRSDRRRALWIHATTTPPEVHKVLTILAMEDAESSATA